MSNVGVGANTSSNDASKPSKVVEAAVEEARKAIGDLLTTESNCPHFIRIAFYDAISYNPIAKVDGPNGSIRIWEGLAKEVEMKKAMESLDSLKRGNPNVGSYISYADLYQLAGIEAVKKAGGPSTIEFRHGRTDSCIPSKIPIEAIEEGTNAKLLRDTFHRIGFTDKEIVALSSSYYYWMNYGRSSEQPKINTSYYEKLLKEKEVTKIEASNSSSATTPSRSNTNTASTPPTLRYWKCLLSDASFRKHVVHFSENAKAFEMEYTSAHKKLSELGFKHFPEPILTETEYHDIKHGIAFAVAMTILFGFVGFFYEAMRTHT